jgi:dTDP-4-dehydrorhamnose reductase
MRILVTGREGQVARSIAERLGERHELIFAGRPGFDLTDRESVVRAVAEATPEMVVSAAAYTAVDRAETEPDLAMAVNAEGPRFLAEACARAGIAIVHLSTDYVFDGSGDRPWREDDPTGPVNVYGRTKLAGEQAIREAGGQYAILRTSWVYSPFGTNFVKTMLRLARDRDTLNVVDDQIGCPTSAIDIADGIGAVARCWEEGEGPCGTYHLGGSEAMSWADFARATFAQSMALGGPHAQVTGIATEQYPTPARRPLNSRIDSRAFADDFGFAMPDWRDSLQEVVSRLVN